MQDTLSTWEPLVGVQTDLRPDRAYGGMNGGMHPEKEGGDCFGVVK